MEVFRLPPDDRGFNYDKYFDEGKELMQYLKYTSPMLKVINS